MVTLKLAGAVLQAAVYALGGICWALAARVRQAAKQVKRRATFMGFPSNMRFNQHGIRLVIPGCWEKDAVAGEKFWVEAWRKAFSRDDRAWLRRRG